MMLYQQNKNDAQHESLVLVGTLHYIRFSCKCEPGYRLNAAETFSYKHFHIFQYLASNYNVTLLPTVEQACKKYLRVLLSSFVSRLILLLASNNFCVIFDIYVLTLQLNTMNTSAYLNNLQTSSLQNRPMCSIGML